MFCTACAAHNPATLPRCAAYGASPRRAAERPRPRRSAGRGRILRMLLALPILLATLADSYSVRAYRADRSALAAAYARGEAAVRAGDDPDAIAASTDAGTYADAKERRAAMIDALAPYRVAYLTGLDALDAGDYDGAIDAFLTVVRALPDDERAQSQLAETRRDWLGAERTLVPLLADEPDNVDYRARLTILSRTHAPVLYAREGAISTVGPDLLDQRLVMDALPAVWPAWSPDGTKIAYTSLERFELQKEEGVAALHVVDVATGADTNLTTTPGWSADGSRLTAPSADPMEASLIVDLSIGGEQTDLDLPFDDDSGLAGPPQWSAARVLSAPGPPTIGGAALDNGYRPMEESSWRTGRARPSGTPPSTTASPIRTRRGAPARWRCCGSAATRPRSTAAAAPAGSPPSCSSGCRRDA